MILTILSWYLLIGVACAVPYLLGVCLWWEGENPAAVAWASAITVAAWPLVLVLVARMWREPLPGWPGEGDR